MKQEIKEGTLVRIHLRFDLPNSQIANPLYQEQEGRVPLTKFEFQPKGKGKASIEYFPMHLDQLLEGERIKFAGLPSGFLDGKTNYQMRILSGPNEGTVLKTGDGPTYDIDKVRKALE